MSICFSYDYRYGSSNYLYDYERLASNSGEWYLNDAIGSLRVTLDDTGDLLKAIPHLPDPSVLGRLPALDLLRRVWIQQFYQDERGLRWRTADELSPAGVAINSPADPEARYSSKRSTIWVGYKVHVSESCDDDEVHLITNVELTPAPVADTNLTGIIQAHLAQAGRLPSLHLVDAGYMDAEHIVHSRKEYEIDLYGPIPRDPSWQAREQNGYDAGAFVIDWEAKQAHCPQGATSRSWKAGRDGNGNPVVHISFARVVCQTCAVHDQCTKGHKQGRQLNIREQATFQALQIARQRQKTAEFQQQYAARAGIEGTLSRAVRGYGMRQARYVGEAKTRLQMLFAATAINIARISTFLASKPPPKRAHPPFRQLAHSAITC